MRKQRVGQPVNTIDLAHRIKGALGALDMDVELESNDTGALLMAVHPQLGATMAVELRTAAQTATMLLMFGEWDSLRCAPAEVQHLATLNARLITCAVGLVDVGDQQVVALTRTIPASDVAPERVADLVAQMAWEYSLRDNDSPTSAVGPNPDTEQS